MATPPGKAPNSNALVPAFNSAKTTPFVFMESKLLDVASSTLATTDRFFAPGSDQTNSKVPSAGILTALSSFVATTYAEAVSTDTPLPRILP